MKQFFDQLYQKSFIDFIQLLKKNIEKNKKMFIVTANPETFMIARNDSYLANILLDSNTTIVADGIGVVTAAHMLDYNVSERIAGIDIATYLLAFAHELKKSMYLFGASQEVIEKMSQRIKTEYPNIILVGCQNGYVVDKDAVMEDMKQKKPDIVMVALGIPTQEALIQKHIADFDHGIFIGVGGSFDVISGTKKRAPKLIQKMKLEWFYRIMKEPKRFKRFYQNNIKFMFEVRKLKK